MKSLEEWVLVDPLRDPLIESLGRHYLLSDTEIQQFILKVNLDLQEIFNEPTEETRAKVVEYFKQRQSLNKKGNLLSCSSKETIQLEKILKDLDAEKSDQTEYEVRDTTRQGVIFKQLGTLDGINYSDWISRLPLSKIMTYEAIYFYHFTELEFNHFHEVRVKIQEMIEDIEKMAPILGDIKKQLELIKKDICYHIYHFDTVLSSVQNGRTSVSSPSSSSSITSDSDDFYSANGDASDSNFESDDDFYSANGDDLEDPSNIEINEAHLSSAVSSISLADENAQHLSSAVSSISLADENAQHLSSTVSSISLADENAQHLSSAVSSISLADENAQHLSSSLSSRSLADINEAPLGSSVSNLVVPYSSDPNSFFASSELSREKVSTNVQNVKLYDSWWNRLHQMCEQHSGKMLLSSILLAASPALFLILPAVTAAIAIASLAVVIGSMFAYLMNSIKREEQASTHNLQAV
jgi:hypothetical protein